VTSSSSCIMLIMLVFLSLADGVHCCHAHQHGRATIWGGELYFIVQCSCQWASGGISSSQGHHDEALTASHGGCENSLRRASSLPKDTVMHLRVWRCAAGVLLAEDLPKCGKTVHRSAGPSTGAQVCHSGTVAVAVHSGFRPL
jgi:hypothetical protein